MSEPKPKFKPPLRPSDILRDMKERGEKNIREVKVGDVIQLSPAVPDWGCCLCIVSERKSWGVQCYSVMPNSGEAYYRAEWMNFEIVGHALWGENDTVREVHPEDLTAFTVIRRKADE